MLSFARFRFSTAALQKLGPVTQAVMSCLYVTAFLCVLHAGMLHARCCMGHRGRYLGRIVHQIRRAEILGGLWVS